MKNRRLQLGDSLSSFMAKLGLNPSNGGTGAKHSDARRLRDQMERLFRGTISFGYSCKDQTRKVVDPFFSNLRVFSQKIHSVAPGVASPSSTRPLRNTAR